MAYPNKEYIETQTITYEELFKIKEAQFNMRTKGYEDQNESQLKAVLGASSTVLAMAFMLATPITLAAGVLATVLSWPSELDQIIEVCENGEDFLQTVYNIMHNSNYDMVELKLPYLEFTGEDYRIVHGTGEIVRVHGPNGWLLS